MYSKTFSIVACILASAILSKPIVEVDASMTSPAKAGSINKGQPLESSKDISIKPKEAKNVGVIKEAPKTFTLEPKDALKTDPLTLEKKDSKIDQKEESSDISKSKDVTSKLSKRNDSPKAKSSQPTTLESGKAQEAKKDSKLQSISTNVNKKDASPSTKQSKPLASKESKKEETVVKESSGIKQAVSEAGKASGKADNKGSNFANKDTDGIEGKAKGKKSRKMRRRLSRRVDDKKIKSNKSGFANTKESGDKKKPEPTKSSTPKDASVNAKEQEKAISSRV